MKKETAPTEINVISLKTGVFDVNLLGLTPLILHHGSVKPHLLPAAKLSRVERATTLKHEPLEEWKERMILAGDDQPTRLLFPVAAFKGAMMTAALRLPGTIKTEIAQLAWIDGEYASLYGTPRVFIRTVRNSDMARTPDARTRPILGRWACRLTVRYSMPMLSAQHVANLLTAGGLICGVGDWRPEKGKGTFGQFEIVDAKDPRLAELLTEGREVQDRAINDGVAFDGQTLDALDWYHEQLAAARIAGRTQESRRKKSQKSNGGSDASGLEATGRG